MTNWQEELRFTTMNIVNQILNEAKVFDAKFRQSINDSCDRFTENIIKNFITATIASETEELKKELEALRKVKKAAKDFLKSYKPNFGYNTDLRVKLLQSLIELDEVRREDDPKD